MAAKKKIPTAAPSQSDPQAPLDAAAFLSAAQRVLAVLRDDLLTRADESPGVTEALKAQWEVEKEAQRTGDPWEVWRRRVVVQVAAAWVLSLAFARTLEDRGLLERNRIAGPGATDSQEQFRAIAPYLFDRDYLLTVFGELSTLPAAKDLFDPAHNPVWKLGPSIEGARALLDLFRAPDPESPAFRFGQADTHFLGDLYQNLDEETRERFALLQTPAFVEKYVLDRTLERAIARFGLDDTTLIDPTCGSGHFLLGAFERLVDHRLRKEPGLDVRGAARRALDAVYGADINPYAVAIARFRLTLAFVQKAGYSKLADAPHLPLHLVVADSLLHNSQHVQAKLGEAAGQSMRAWGGDEFALEDEAAARDVLHRRFAAVVGNPPYITAKDSVLRERYKELYCSCFREFTLATPFTERFFQLAKARGFVGLITESGFMKRDRGKKLIESYLPTVNVDGIVNTSGAYIPGHGTPTVLLFGTNEPKKGDDVLTVLAKRGEPSIPSDPEQGLVWRSIVDHGSEVGFENDYVSVARQPRTMLEKHPWSLGGGGAAELKELLESRAVASLTDLVDLIGFGAVTREDELFELPLGSARRFGIEPEAVAAYGFGEAIRDWSFEHVADIVLPYDRTGTLPPQDLGRWIESAWRLRAQLWLRQGKGFKTKKESGGQFYEYSMFYPERLFAPLKIAFAFVATHNHFVIDRGGKVFKQSAPIIKLKDGSTEDDYLALQAYLNSSTACFWMKQVFYPKGGDVAGDGGRLSRQPHEDRYEFAGTGLNALPIPPDTSELLQYARQMNELASKREQFSPTTTVDQIMAGEATMADVSASEAQHEAIFRQMVALQEVIDWHVYRLFQLPCVAPVIPAELLPEGRQFAVSVGATRGEVALIEGRMFKRPWGGRDVSEATRRKVYSAAVVGTAWGHVLGQIERELGQSVVPMTERDVAQRHSVRELVARMGPYGSDSGLGEQVRGQAVPFLAALRHTPSGLEKRAQWNRVWELQRAEDRGEKVPPFDPPPKYDQKDYRDAAYWHLRGKLDLPKERFVSYPTCESDEDGEAVYGWAGWNHLQQAIALATLYLKRRQGEAWAKERLVPMLAGLDELVPWIWQWHAEPTLESGGMKPGQYVADFLSAQCLELGVTVEELRAWRPSTTRGARRAAPEAVALVRPNVTPEEEAVLLLLALVHARPSTRIVLARAFALLHAPTVLKQLAPPHLKSRAKQWAQEVKGRSPERGAFRTVLNHLLAQGTLVDGGAGSTIRVAEASATLAPQAWWLGEAQLALAAANGMTDEAVERLASKLPSADRPELRVSA